MIFKKIFKKRNKEKVLQDTRNFEIGITASILAYEVARSDGNVSESELLLLLDEIKKITKHSNQSQEKILGNLQTYSENSVSFYEFITDINHNYSKEDKLNLLKFLYDVAFADKVLEINEERIIRRIANLINIKDVEVLRIKDISKKKINNL